MLTACVALTFGSPRCAAITHARMHHEHSEAFCCLTIASVITLCSCSDVRVYDSEIAYELYAPYDTTKTLKKLKAEVKCYLETVSAAES
jgi:hypothetical protein